jgi:hypothetical protein
MIHQEWIEDEFCKINFGDCRLDKRLISLTSKFFFLALKLAYQMFVVGGLRRRHAIDFLKTRRLTIRKLLRPIETEVLRELVTTKPFCFFRIQLLLIM